MNGQPGAAVERVLAALSQSGSRIVHSGAEYKAQCPHPDHDDNDPSLSIKQGNEGALVKCQSRKCPLDDILGVLGLDKSALFDNPREKRQVAKPQVVAEYPYVDEQGELLYTVKRSEPGYGGKKKSFLPYLPGAPKSGLGEVRRVLYRLPQLIAAIAADEIVFIAEGEKSVDALRERGVAATTNPNGAGKWRPEFDTYFVGAKVTVVADRDDDGVSHARNVVDHLRKVAASVEIVQSAVIAAKADVVEHIAAGFGLDELVPLDPPSAAELPGGQPTKLASLALDPENQATLIVELASKNFELFSSPDGRAWAIDQHGPNVAIPIGRRSSKFSKVLARRFIEEHHKAPGEQAVGDAVRIITAFLDDDDPRPVFLRTARHEDSIVIDLGRADGQCVIVTAEGWTVEPRSPVPFRRGKTAPLPIPARSASGLQALRKLCNVSDNTFRLMVGCLVAYLVPGIPYVVMVIRGEQGRAKSTLAKILVRCIDPGRDPGPLPRDERNFSIRMWNGHVHAFDNVSDIAPYQSDMICRAATGADYGERTLYADDELTSMAYCCPVILNGIDLGAVPPDLADREATIEPGPIKRRRTEHTVIGGKSDIDEGVLDEFAKAHPKILGALLDLLSGVLRYSPEVSKADLPRMADFAVVLGALDKRYEAIHGKPHTDPLMDMYRALARKVVADAAQDDVLGSALLRFMSDKADWQGTSGGLYKALTAALPEPAKPPKGWPASVESFGHRLPKINPALRANGWEVIRGEHSVNGRPVRIQACPLSGAKPSGPSHHHAGHSDLREQPDGGPDSPADGPTAVSTDDLFAVTREQPHGDLADGSSDGVQGLPISGEAAGQAASDDGPDRLTVSPQITGTSGPDGAAVALLRHHLGAELIEPAANGQHGPGRCEKCHETEESLFHAAACLGAGQPR